MKLKKSTKSKIDELFEFDYTAGGERIVGTDEAGRGPGAGPVFAAAVCFTKIDEGLKESLSILNDSKQLTEKHREELFEILTHTDGCVWSIAEGTVAEIEKYNILNTSLNCMKRSCEDVLRRLEKSGVRVLVDGNKKIKNFAPAQETVVKGDSKSAAIAAASILAKVARDRLMLKLAQDFPEYGWERNKGYLTAEHVEAIKKHGTTKHHRPKFLRNILGSAESDTKKQSAQLGLF